MKIKQILTVLTFASLSSMVEAAGYQLNEYSPVNMGRSFAGMGVSNDDYSALAYNPAGMSYQSLNGAQVAVSAVDIHSRFRGYASPTSSFDMDDTNVLRVLPSGFAQYRLNDQLTAGLGIYTPYGLATDYDGDWFGARHGVLSEIDVIDVSPALSYRFNRYFSVGGAVNIQYANAHLTSASSDISGDDSGMGYSVGMTLSPVDCLRMGVSYRSYVKHTLKGDIDRLMSLNSGDVKAKITTPETALFSIAWDVNPKWTLSGSARWTRWKRFGTLKIDLSAPPLEISSVTEENWRNTGFYALGADYRPNKEWTVRGGVGYDMTVIRDSNHRTPRIPDGRRILASTGFSYIRDRMQFDVGYSHIFIWGGHARGTDNLNSANPPNIKYSSAADMLSLGFQYKF